MVMAKLVSFDALRIPSYILMVTRDWITSNLAL